ncbi:hypothetical protein [Pseudonocardia xishanensis]|uniref:Uncharacterized protein n=1 Tax=Pseudonocardia xishanensis TaxID=630995 RepID=A0ABP8S3L9_9PSEU
MSPCPNLEHAADGVLDQHRVDRRFLAIVAELIADEPWHGSAGDDPVPHRAPMTTGVVAAVDREPSSGNGPSPARSQARRRAGRRRALPRERSPPPPGRTP